MRRRSGCNMHPVSSRNTTLAFCSAPLFYPQPLPLLPTLNRTFVLLAGTLLGLLHAPAELVQERAHIVHVIAHVEQLDHFQDSRSRWPERRAAACGSAVFVVYPSIVMAADSEGPSPSPQRLEFESIAPAFHAAGGSLHGLATSTICIFCCNNSTALRRRFSNAALGSGGLTPE